MPRSPADGSVGEPQRPQKRCVRAHSTSWTARPAAIQLQEYFAGKRTRFDLPLAPRGTAFQKAVWAALLRIPFGETASYGELARAIGKPSASRAVGAANGRNPLSIVIPCHRVIGADGSMTGYGGEISRKRILLDLEARVRGTRSGQLDLEIPST